MVILCLYFIWSVGLRTRPTNYLTIWTIVFAAYCWSCSVTWLLAYFRIVLQKFLM